MAARKLSPTKDTMQERGAAPREPDNPAEDTHRDTKLSVPSPNPATNLVIAEIVLRGASTLFRKTVEERVATASFVDEDEAREMLDGRTLLTSLAIYGASKLATRSPVGLGLVAGGLVLKTLYDRGKTRQARRAGSASRRGAEAQSSPN